eukprot:scaffold27092_cov19-Tisochrysis_lutea.AAC.1
MVWDISNACSSISLGAHLAPSQNDHCTSQIKAPEPVHGRLSELQHSGHPLMHHIPSGPQQGFDTV